MDLVTLSRIKNELRNQRTAIQMLGITFCAHCGKPHHTSLDTYVSLQRKTDNGNASVPVCLDQPSNMNCLIAALRYVEEQVDGPDVPHVYDELAKTLATWILNIGAYEKTHPMNGVVQEMITGMRGVEGEDLAFQLMWWRNAPYCTFPAVRSYRDLIDACGWSLMDDEYRSLLNRCMQQAVTKNCKGQVADFEKALKSLDGAVVAGAWSGLGAR